MPSGRVIAVPCGRSETGPARHRHAEKGAVHVREIRDDPPLVKERVHRHEALDFLALPQAHDQCREHKRQNDPGEPFQTCAHVAFSLPPERSQSRSQNQG
jgi:hypothetical protein